MRFRLAWYNPDSRAFTRGVAVIVLMGLVVTWLLFAAGRIGIGLSLIASAGLVFWPAVYVSFYLYARTGAVVFTPESLIVMRRFAQTSYRWDDIANVSLRTFTDKGRYYRAIALMAGVPLSYRFVELRLAKSLRSGLWPLRAGTDARGVGLGKVAVIYVETPQELVRAAGAQLGQW